MVYLHEVDTGKRVRELKQHGDTALHLVFSPDGRFLASMPRSREAGKGEISIWDVRNSKEVHRWTHPFPKAWWATFSPDGKFVAIDGVRWGVVLRDVETGREIHRLSPHGGVYDMAFSPDSKRFSMASPRGAIRQWDAVEGKFLPASADPDVQLVDRLRFSADGKQLFGDAGVCLAWDASTGRELRRLADPRPLDFKHPNDPRFLVLSPDASLLAAANSDKPITLWDTATGKEKHTFQGHGSVWQLSFTPNSQRLISNRSDNLVRLWDVTSGHELHQLPGRAPIVVSPDGRLLAAADANATHVFLYDLATGQERKRFVFQQQGQVFGLAFTPDGRSLAAVGHVGVAKRPGEARVWNVTTGELVLSIDSQKTPVWSVACSPDGRTVATGDADGSLVLWELASGRQRHAFAGHESRIVSLAFSPDGRALAASSADAPVYVWEVAGTLQSEPRRPSNDELQRPWSALAGEDAPAAFQAIRRLAATPEQTLPFLRQHLKPVPEPDSKRIRQLLEMLDSDDFQTRQKAAEDLEKQNDAAASLLRQIIAKEKPSLEVRRRLQQIVENIESKPESLRAVRAVEVLEWIATPEAVRLVGELANGAADARLTHEAAAARNRLRR
jgi:WD40 repeat protein